MAGDSQAVARTCAALVPFAVSAGAGNSVYELSDVAGRHVTAKDGAMALTCGAKDQKLAVGREADVGVIVGCLIVETVCRDAAHLAQRPGIAIDL